jgi:hypothetical protein
MEGTTRREKSCEARGPFERHLSQIAVFLEGTCIRSKAALNNALSLNCLLVEYN